MKKNQTTLTALSGAVAGAVNGLFGAGGGMVLLPLLTATGHFANEELFPASVSIILPICLVSLGFRWVAEGLPFVQALPYLIGSALGGILCGIWGKKIPTIWLHRMLGVFILWAGVRYLC